MITEDVKHSNPYYFVKIKLADGGWGLLKICYGLHNARNFAKYYEREYRTDILIA